MPATCRATSAKAHAMSPGPHATSRTVSSARTLAAARISSGEWSRISQNGTACRVNWSKIRRRCSSFACAMPSCFRLRLGSGSETGASTSAPANISARGCEQWTLAATRFVALPRLYRAVRGLLGGRTSPATLSIAGPIVVQYCAEDERLVDRNARAAEQGHKERFVCLNAGIARHCNCDRFCCLPRRKCQRAGLGDEVLAGRCGRTKGAWIRAVDGEVRYRHQLVGGSREGHEEREKRRLPVVALELRRVADAHADVDGRLATPGGVGIVQDRAD